MGISHVDLRNKMDRSFDIEEFKSICWELELDYDNLEGSTKIRKIEELIRLQKLRGQLDQLVEICSSLRSKEDWRGVAPREGSSEAMRQDSFVRIKLGDIFDGPTDLIVLPCSTDGTVTHFVARRLHQYSIPSPPAKMALGSVEVLPFEGAGNVAQYVAFAVSVYAFTSTVEAVTNIGRELGQATRNNETIRSVSVPLLGAGAGGLDSEVVVDALSSGFKESAASGATLTIFVLHNDVYERLVSRGAKTTSESESREPLRLFISYAGTRAFLEEWVVELGTFLRANGIDARLDRWHLRSGMDLPQWMANELDMAERVIVVADSRYAERADRRLGGIDWVTLLIQGDMYQQQPKSRKYVVIVRDRSLAEGTPQYLNTKFCIHWPDDTNEESRRNDLLKELYDVDLAPPIGATPTAYIN